MLKQALNTARYSPNKLYCIDNGAIVASLDQAVFHRLS